MAIFAISDLHLALSADKPMDVFGSRWANYMERIKENWEASVGEDDTVLLPGDISWATYALDAVADFAFIDRLPGKKIISKGNHDYWWTTMSKLERFLQGNNFKSISFMHNNSFVVEGHIICGTRGWKMPGEDGFSAEDNKIYQRELQRLELSLKSMKKSEGGKLLVAMHYPVFNSKGVFSDFLPVMKKYGVDTCIYGHLHGESHIDICDQMHEGILFRLVSADYLKFKPVRVDS